jgi:hypothetical protein
VKNVLYFEDLTMEKMKELRGKYHPRYVPEGSRYATIIFLEEIRRVGPLKINKRTPAGWVVLDPQKHPYYKDLMTI